MGALLSNHHKNTEERKERESWFGFSNVISISITKISLNAF